MRFLIFLFLILLKPLVVHAEGKMYEYEIYYHPALEDVAFFFGTVQYQSDMILKRTLQSEPQTKLIVLASFGGSMYGGMRASSVIHQAGIDTYVPERVACMSACSSMFFAGKNRWVEGDLGVHQFRSGDDTEEVSAAVKEVEAQAQFKMSDVITVLSDYDLPNFVLPRMLSTHWSDMHIFTDTEKVSLMEKNAGQLPSSKDCIEKVAWFLMENFYSEESLERTMPTCELPAQDVATDIVRTAFSNGINMNNATYSIESCEGDLTAYLSSGSINISKHRRSFNGRNISVNSRDGRELLFGNPRVYVTDTGDMVSENGSESMLIDGKFEPITLALINDHGQQNLPNLLVLSGDQKTKCDLKP